MASTIENINAFSSAVKEQEERIKSALVTEEGEAKFRLPSVGSEDEAYHMLVMTAMQFDQGMINGKFTLPYIYLLNELKELAGMGEEMLCDIWPDFITPDYIATAFVLAEMEGNEEERKSSF